MKYWNWKVAATFFWISAQTVESPLAEEAQACIPERHAELPVVVGLDYKEFRERLIQTGWQPNFVNPMQRNEADAIYGNGPALLEAGFHEMVSCSGAGLAYCRFEFSDVYSNQLAVVTIGEVWEEQPFPSVDSFFFICDN